MTIKHQNKNISAEKQYVITDVQDNPNGILTFTLSNLYSNTTDTLQIDLSKHKLKLTKVTQSELNRLKNSQDEIDIKNRESHIYLVQKNTSDEGVYQEFIWVDDDFEIIGSTAINLEPYFLKENIYNGLDYDQNNNTKALSAYQGYLLNQNKINKSDIATNLTTDNDNKVLSAKQGKLLQDNKLNKNQIPYKGKNVVVDNNSGEITFEDKPTIPEASTTTPLSDSTNGSTGNSDKWAKEDHVHPKSNLYAESGHNHDNTYIKLSNTAGLVKNDGTIDTSTYLIESNFKTIDGNSIVGSGNISLPSKLSDLTNDAGFITLSALNDYVTKDNLSIKYSNEKPTEVDPSEPYSLCIVKSSNGYDVYSIQESSTGDSGEWVKSATIPSDFAVSSHNHNDLYYTKSEVDNMNLGGGGEVDLSNYIRKSSTSGLVKNDGSIDTTSYLSSLPNHTHTTSEITDIISIIAGTAEDNATDVMNKIGMAYFLRNQTVYDVTGTVTNYWQEVMQYGLSAVLLDHIVNKEGVYEVRKNQNGMQTTDLFYYYNGDSKLTLLTPMKVDWSISNYNPNIDSTVTVRARIMDMFDNAISYENVTLNYEAGGVGGSVNLISDSDGYVSYEYTCSSWGQCRFSIKTYDTFINVEPKWEQILNEEHYELYVKKDRVRFVLNLNTSTSFPSSFTDFDGGAKIPVGYRPWAMLTAVNVGNYNTVACIKKDGTVARRSLTDSTINATGWFRWEYTI